MRVMNYQDNLLCKGNMAIAYRTVNSEPVASVAALSIHQDTIYTEAAVKNEIQLHEKALLFCDRPGRNWFLNSTTWQRPNGADR